MKVAIVTDSFNGSSSALVEALLQQGCEVDFFNIIGAGKRFVELESFSLPRKPLAFYQRITQYESFGLRRFKSYAGKLRFYVFAMVHCDSKPGYLANFKRTLCLIMQNPLICLLQKGSYDFINVIGQEQYSLCLSLRLKKKGLNVVHSLHEVLDNHLAGGKLNPPALSLINNHVPINVFSKKSFDDIKTGCGQNRISCIPFGLFTGYQEYEDVDIPELSGCDDYVLNYGYIVKYKGLDILYEAATNLKDKRIKIVIAGRGSLPVLEKMKNDKQFIVINRWLGNAELATLIRHSKCVVCPYLSASQSGIPQTVFNFDKPIIATDIESFQEVIHTGVNGMIIERNNPLALASAITKIYSEREAYGNMVNNIRKYRCEDSKKEWLSIAQKYMEIYSK